MAGEGYAAIIRRLKSEGYKEAATELGDIGVRRELKRLACEAESGVRALFFVEWRELAPPIISLRSPT